MSIQDSISKSFVDWKRRIRDYAVSNTGFQGQVIRVKATQNMYGDESIEVIDSNIITISLDIPDEIPLNRLRKDVVTPSQIQTQNTHLYDILPIRGQARFADNVEEGDFLIHKIYDEGKEVDDPYLWILRVSELLGSISVRHLTHITFYCAPYAGVLPQKVQDIIETYEDDQEF